jgi:Flp pilus assembly pilin Flp
MRKLLERFTKAEDGAVTVDWVIMTAGVVGLNIIVLVGWMETSMVEVSDSIGDKVTEYEALLD